MDNRPSTPEDERLRILRMVEQRKISASEGISLLEALGNERKTATPAAPAGDPPKVIVPPDEAGAAAIPLPARTGQQPSSQPAPERPAGGGMSDVPGWLRIRVTDLASGRSKVTVNLPLGLVDWGMRIGSQFAPEMRDMNLPDMVRLLKEDGVRGKLVDVMDEEDGEHVEIFVE